MSPNHYTVDQVVELLASKQGDRNQRDFAAEIGVSQQYLCNVLLQRQSPGPAILEYLGLEKAFVKSKQAA